MQTQLVDAEPEKVLSDTELFRNVMQETANQFGLDMEFFQEGLNIRFTNPSDKSERYELLKYDFGLNSHQSMVIAKDKTKCSDYVLKANIPAVEHHLLENISSFEDRGYTKEVIQLVKGLYSFPIVVKQNDGGGGKNILFAFDDIDLTLAIANLSHKRVPIALSPFYDFNIEYRCTVLDGEVLMSYGKTKGDNLQNNLSKGAQVVDVPEHLKEELHSLASRTAKALNLRFTNIDIIDTKEGLKVLEVNGTVCLKRVLRNSVDRQRQAINVYVQALKKLINK